MKLQEINHYKWTGWVWEISGWSSWLPMITDRFRGNSKVMQDYDWQFCLGLNLHPGRRPLFIPSCKCISKKIWACSNTRQKFPLFNIRNRNIYVHMFRNVLKSQTWCRICFFFFSRTLIPSTNSQTLGIQFRQCLQVDGGHNPIPRAKASSSQPITDTFP